MGMVHFKNKKKEKIEELETFCQIKNIRDLYRGINDFKNCYQPRATCVVSLGKTDLCLLTTSTFFVNRISHLTVSYFN